MPLRLPCPSARAGEGPQPFWMAGIGRLDPDRGERGGGW